ncbi:MAG: MerR family transcriptional regulator [Dehalococcoidales bacterium]|nr:MerR family transcriptional regulator [Dehalococcoidales bacterium]
MNEREPRYVISVAARMLDTQTYTLRYYEKVGIIRPRRSRGNVRLYSDYDIALLKKIKSLVDDMGINLPGVEVILRIMQRVDELQQALEQAHSEIEQLRGGDE